MFLPIHVDDTKLVGERKFRNEVGETSARWEGPTPLLNQFSLGTSLSERLNLIINHLARKLTNHECDNLKGGMQLTFGRTLE